MTKMLFVLVMIAVTHSGEEEIYSLKTRFEKLIHCQLSSQTVAHRFILIHQGKFEKLYVNCIPEDIFNAIVKNGKELEL